VAVADVVAVAVAVADVVAVAVAAPAEACQSAPRPPALGWG
jgi:hypothetical protein